jgi:AraC-like ligand binding domain
MVEVAPPDFLIVDPPTTGLQRLRARFSGHAYDRHRHETYAVGVTEAGLQCFHYRGAARTSMPGRIVVLYPDEVHDGHAGAPTGFVYSMLYVDPSLIAAAVDGRALPFCGEPVLDDLALRHVLAEAFIEFPRPIEDLALPALVTALADALARHAGALRSTTRVSGKAIVTTASCSTPLPRQSAPRRWKRKPGWTATHSPARSAPRSARRPIGI